MQVNKNLYKAFQMWSLLYITIYTVAEVFEDVPFKTSAVLNDKGKSKINYTFLIIEF